MPIPVVQSVAVTFTATATTSIAANLPSGVASGDLLVAQLWAGGTIPTPSGWNLIRTQPESTFGSGETRTYYRIANGSEGPTVTFTWTDVKYGNVGIARITGHDAVTPINADAGTAGGNTDTQTSPAVTTTVPDCLILRMLASDRIGITPTSTPAGHTEIWDQNGAVSFDASATVAATIGQASAGSSGTAQFVMSATRPVPLQTIAIAGAAGGTFDLGMATLISESAASGALRLAIAMSGALVSESVIQAAQLRLAMGITSVLISESVLSGDLSLTDSYQGTLASVSAASGTLRLSIGLAGSLISESVLAGSMRLSIRMTGALVSESRLTGDLAIGVPPVFFNVSLQDLTPVFSLSDLTGAI